MKLMLSAFGVIVCALVIYGCKKKVPPPPPRIKGELTLQLFADLADKNFSDALPKIIRLKELEPDNVFLARLENLIRNNIYITQAQKYTDKGELNKALFLLQKALEKHGLQPEIVEAKKTVLILKTVTLLIKNIKNAKNSFQLAKNAVKLKRIIKKYPQAASLKTVVDNAIKKAKRMNLREKERALFGISSDIVSLLENDNVEAMILFAELEVEAPRHPILKSLYSFLYGKTNTIQTQFINQ